MQRRARARETHKTFGAADAAHPGSVALPTSQAQRNLLGDFGFLVEDRAWRGGRGARGPILEILIGAMVPIQKGAQIIHPTQRSTIQACTCSY